MGQVTGVVTDVSGARVANAEISLDNPLSWRQTRTVSDSQGQFHIKMLPYGTYVLHISAKGFTPSSKQFRIRTNVPVEFFNSFNSGGNRGEKPCIRICVQAKILRAQRR